MITNGSDSDLGTRQWHGGMWPDEAVGVSECSGRRVRIQRRTCAIQLSMSDTVWVHPFGEAGLNRVGMRLRVLWTNTRGGVRDEGARPRYRAFETRGALYKC